MTKHEAEELVARINDSGEARATLIARDARGAPGKVDTFTVDWDVEVVVLCTNDEGGAA